MQAPPPTTASSASFDGNSILNFLFTCNNRERVHRFTDPSLELVEPCVCGFCDSVNLSRWVVKKWNRNETCFIPKYGHPHSVFVLFGGSLGRLDGVAAHTYVQKSCLSNNTEICIVICGDSPHLPLNDS